MPHFFSDHADKELMKSASMRVRTNGIFIGHKNTCKPTPIDFLDYISNDEYLAAAFQRGLARDFKTFIDPSLLPTPITQLPHKIPLGFQPEICRAYQIFVEESYLVMKNTGGREGFLKKMRNGRYALNMVKKLALTDEIRFNNLLESTYEEVVKMTNNFANQFKLPQLNRTEAETKEKPKPPNKLPNWKSREF